MTRTLQSNKEQLRTPGTGEGRGKARPRARGRQGRENQPRGQGRGPGRKGGGKRTKKDPKDQGRQDRERTARTQGPQRKGGGRSDLYSIACERKNGTSIRPPIGSRHEQTKPQHEQNPNTNKKKTKKQNLQLHFICPFIYFTAGSRSGEAGPH